ncbi:MAG: serpin family protein [Anaerovoracaceae bacterium]|jgi:serine protease inhibitor
MIEKYIKKYNEINSILLRDLSAAAADDNVVFSAASLITLLAVAAQSAAGETRAEIVRALTDDEDRDSLIETVCEMQRILSAGGELKSANAVFISDEIEASVRPGYGEKLHDIFKADLIVTGDIVSDLNRWVNEKTEGMIHEIADESMSKMVIGMLNAMFFDADWAQDYEDDDISWRTFTNADGTKVKVPMMQSRESAYLENESFTGFVRDYDGDFSFLALLPKEEGRESLVGAVTELDISELYQNIVYCEVEAVIPEFALDFGCDLTDPCKRMGIRELFGSNADLSPLSSAEQLVGGGILHQARIEVDRRGTRAAAATVFYTLGSAAPEPRRLKKVSLNRPFLFAIVEKNMGLPLFTGQVCYLDDQK